MSLLAERTVVQGGRARHLLLCFDSASSRGTLFTHPADLCLLYIRERHVDRLTNNCLLNYLISLHFWVKLRSKGEWSCNKYMQSSLRFKLNMKKIFFYDNYINSPLQWIPHPWLCCQSEAAPAPVCASSGTMQLSVNTHTSKIYGKQFPELVK